MPWDRFLIAPYDANSGLQNNFRPWLISDTAFSTLNNAYVFRGRVRKRFGSTPLFGDVLGSRLRINIGTTNGAGTIIATIANAPLVVGQLISIGASEFTITTLGTPANLLRSDGVAATATINTTTGALNIVSSIINEDVFFYPTLPVVGMTVYENSFLFLNIPIVFDTQYAYQITNGTWGRAGTAVWTGGISNLFWGATFRGAVDSTSLLFVSNFHYPDPIRYWDGTTWTNFSPQYNAAGNTIGSALLIIPFKNRLLFLGVIEIISGAPVFAMNRCRFSQNGSPLDATAFREDIPGRGGFLDCTTQESIINAGIIKDRLIVKFERSTYELVYTNNEILPFRWQQLNAELGAFSTFSGVPFDKVLLDVGETGFHACNGVNVERIDQLIPDQVFQISTNGGQLGVYGIRDYYLEVVYWAIPMMKTVNQVFNNKVLVYNYKTGTWAYNDDTFTTFGYLFDNQHVMAGNQQGYTFNLLGDVYRNAPSLQITNIDTSLSPTIILTVIDHNLIAGGYILIENAVGITGLNNNIYQIVTVIDQNTLTITQAGTTGAYLGGGTIATVSIIDIQSKQYNFYTDQDTNAAIQKVDFFVTATPAGQIAIDYLVGSSPLSLVNEGINTGAIVGTSVLETFPYPSVTFEASQVRLWHPTYFQADGESIQIRLYLSSAQMLVYEVALSNFELNAIAIYATPTASRMQ